MKQRFILITLLMLSFLFVSDKLLFGSVPKTFGQESAEKAFTLLEEAQIDFGETVPGTISVAAEVDSFTFSAEDEDIVLIRVSKTSGDLWPRVRLIDHRGNLIGDEHHPTHVEIVTTIPQTYFIYLPSILTAEGTKRDASQAADQGLSRLGGDPATYTILISDGFNGANTGSYNLHIQRLNPPINPTTINYGQTLPGTINLAAATQAFVFNGEAGDQIIAGLSEVSGEIWMGLRLYDPHGQLLTNDEHPSNLELNYYLPVSGTYTLLTYDGFDGTLTGSYSLFLQKLNPPESATAIAYGELKPGTINLPAEMDSFTFIGTINDKIIVNLSKVSGDIWMCVRLYDPDGQLLITDENPNHAEISYQLPVTGNYSLLICDGFNKTMTGSYNLFLQRLNPPVNPTPISYEQTLPGNITLPAEKEFFTFAGNSGDNVLITVSKTGGNIWPGVRLYDGDGNQLNSDGGPASAEINHTLPANGVYTILIHDSFNGTFTGNFNLNLKLLP